MNFKEIINNVFTEYIEDLDTLVSIPSIYEKSSVYPYGENIQKALEETVKIANRMGFETYIDPSGHYAYAQIGSGEMFGVLGHLDVVPIGDITMWNSDPFKIKVEDGKIYGRGTQDDKGPMLGAMYALKILIDSGFKLKKQVRFIFGTDEESLWRDMKVYQELEEMPTMGFSPDSKFPLIYAEKGLLQVKLKGASSNINFSGGDAFNSVPSKLKYTLDNVDKFKQNLDKLGFEYNAENEVIGKAVHAQVANTGINAITRTFLAMQGIYDNSNSINFVNNFVGEDSHAVKIFGSLEDEHSGKLMFNVGKFDFNDEYEELSIDIRIPVSVSKDEVVSKLKLAASEYNLEYTEYDWLRSIYVPLDSELIVNLMEAYSEVTGDYESKPITSGGATYARAMDNCVAFGAVLPTGTKTEHQPNEYIVVDEMKKAIEIYIKAFEKLV